MPRGIDRVDVTDNALTLSLAQFNAYRSAGIDAIDATDNAISLSAATAAAYLAAGFSFLGSDRVVIRDSAQNIAMLSASQLAAFANGFDDVIPDSGVRVTLSELDAFTARGVTFETVDAILADTAP